MIFSLLVLLIILQVTHALDVHCGNSWVEWEMVTNADAVIARDREEAFDKQPSSVGPQWRCGRCLEMPYEPDKMTYPAMQKHLDTMCVVFKFSLISRLIRPSRQAFCDLERGKAWL